MITDIRKYFEKQEEPKKTKSGPVITISRDYGCRANEVAQELIQHLNARMSVRKKPHPWKVLNNEFLKEAAKNLNLPAYKLEHVLNPHHKSLLEDFLASYSREYVADHKILRSIKELVNSYAESGNLIIVGRAGVAVTRNLPWSLHIKLEAPLAWRVEYLKTSKNITLEEAQGIAHQIDQRRKLFISQMRKEPYDEALFDVIYNRATLGTDAIVKSLLQLLKWKEII